MKKLILCLCAASVLASAKEAMKTTNTNTIQDVTFENVSMQDHFWRVWQEKQSQVTIPAALRNTENAVENLKIAGEYLQGDRSRMPANLPVYVCSDLFKIMESAAYSLMIHRDPKLEKRLDQIIDIIASAQKRDGYLYAAQVLGLHPHMAGVKPYSSLYMSHELYNVGHMYEGAVAYYKATGKDKWLKISEKNAQHVDKVFFQGGDPNYNEGKPVYQVDGHEEIELALCKLSEATGDASYLELARKFLDIRGTEEATESDESRAKLRRHSRSYSQQHMPVAEQRKPVGHAVRALYLYTAMAAVDALSDSPSYDEALDAIWGNLVSTRMHITGGLGAIAAIEGFGAEYELPNKSTYNETCAAVANVFFNHRMFLRTREAKYLDVLEVSLFNSALSGISLPGDHFFYENPLEADGVSNFNHGAKVRTKWLSCACCPPNISRLLMQVSGYFYAHDDDAIWVGLYGSSSGTFKMGGDKVTLRQQSEYPYEGAVKIKISLEKPKKFTLRLRIPTWAEGREFVPEKLYAFIDSGEPGKVSIRINGEEFSALREEGFALLEREWKDGDEVSLRLPMKLHRVHADPRVEADRGFSCFTFGPLVLCAEEVDNGGRVQDIYVPRSVDISSAKIERFSEGIMKGIPFVRIDGMKLGESELTKVVLIPYFSWNNRGGDSMRVWLPETVEVAEATRMGNLFSDLRGKIKEITTSDGSPYPDVLFDGRVADSSDDVFSSPYWRSKEAGSEEVYVEVKFVKSVKLKEAGVYFIRGRTPSDLPQSWKIQYAETEGGEFRDMAIYLTDSYTCEPHKFNIVHPSIPLELAALRFVFKPRPHSRMGASEIQLGLDE